VKLLFVVFVMAGLMVAGCGKSQPTKEMAAVNTESFMLKEGDAMVAQPTGASGRSAAVVSATAPVADVVVNSEEAPLVETVTAAADVVTGDSPDDKAIQTALKNLGLYSGDIDGVIGPKTKDAIKAFQSQNGLEADGKVGPKTWAALKSALSAPAASTVQN
jgi:peptidoglycan hydrolase-like protein with peptidoglycan-binding domain